MSCYWMRIDGVSARTIGSHNLPTWETLADGGCGAASWTFNLPMGHQHHALRAGALVEILLGATLVYSGELTEPDRTTWECHAKGLAFRNKLALDAVGDVTRDVGVAIGHAIARGWQVSNPYNAIGGWADGDSTDPQSVGALLDQYAEQTGQRWGVGPDRVLYLRSDPTIPAWITTPGAAAFGATNEGVAGLLALRYTEGGVNKTVLRGDLAADEEPVDLTERGEITTAQAESIGDQILATRTSSTGWVNGVTLSRSQLTTAGGTRAALAAVRAGQLLRTHGLALLAGDAGATWRDVVIGKTRYTAGDDVIYLEPVNTAPRNLRDVIAAA